MRLSCLTMPVTALLVSVAVLCPAATATASEQILRHHATGFVAKAPRDFSVDFKRRSVSYVIASRQRHAAIRYKRIRTRRTPRSVGRVLLRRLGAEAVREHAGRRAYRALMSGGRVLRVQRTGPRNVKVTYFQRRAWSGKRQPLLQRVRRSARGGETSPLPVATGPTRRAPARVVERRAPEPERRAPEPQPAPGAPQSPEPAGDTLLRSDFESGTFADWYVQSIPGRATILDSGAFGSRHAARFEVREGDREPDTGSERSEISLEDPTFDEGQDLYFRDTFRIPRNSAIGGSWHIIQQIRELDWGGSPGVAVFVRPGPTLMVASGDSRLIFLEDKAIEYDRWHDLVYRVMLSRDPTVGFVEIWLDGERQVLDNGQLRLHGRTLQTHGAYLKTGLYRDRDHGGTSVVHHDNVNVGTTLASVTGG